MCLIKQKHDIVYYFNAIRSMYSGQVAGINIYIIIKHIIRYGWQVFFAEQFFVLYERKTTNKKKSEYRCIDIFIYTVEKIICVKRKKNTERCYI